MKALLYGWLTLVVSSLVKVIVKATDRVGYDWWVLQISV